MGSASGELWWSLLSVSVAGGWSTAAGAAATPSCDKENNNKEKDKPGREREREEIVRRMGWDGGEGGDGTGLMGGWMVMDGK